MMGNSDGGERANLVTWFASTTCLALFAVGGTALSQGIKGGGAMGPPAMGPIGPAMAPQAPIFTPPVPVFTPGLGMPQSTSSGTGLPKGSGPTDLIGNGGDGGAGGADPNESRRASAKSNLKQLGLAFQVAPTTDGPWPVPATKGLIMGGGSLRLVSTSANGTFKLGITGPGNYQISLETKDLLKSLKAAGASGPDTPSPNSILIGLLLPAVQKAREAMPVVVQHTYSLDTLVRLNGGVDTSQGGNNLRESGSSGSGIGKVNVILDFPQDGSNPTVTWGDGAKTSIGSDDVASADVKGDAVGEAYVGVIPGDATPQQRSFISTWTTNAKNSPEVGSGNLAGLFVASHIANQSYLKTDDQIQFASGISIETIWNPVRSLTTNDQGAVLLGKLPAGTFDLNVSGENLKAWLNTAVSPTNPQPQETLIELLVVIAIIAMKTDGEPVILGRTLPVTSLPKYLPLKLSVDGNGAPTGTWWDGAPLIALYGNGGNGGLLYGNGGNGITDSSSGSVTPVARKETISHSGGDANNLTIELQNILISSLKTGEVGVVTGVFKPEQSAVSGKTDNRQTVIQQ